MSTEDEAGISYAESNLDIASSSNSAFRRRRPNSLDLSTKCKTNILSPFHPHTREARMAIDIASILMLIIPLLIILVGCELFTNGIEWLGVKLGLAETATGSVLAAVGTALPETVVPIIAIVFGSSSGGEIAEGAILGAPFMLATLAMFVGGVSIYVGYRKGRRPAKLCVSNEHVSLEIKSFMTAFSLAFVAALIVPHLGGTAPIFRYIVAAVLLLLYVIYLRRMLRDTSKKGVPPEHLYFNRFMPCEADEPPKTATVLFQVVAALVLIIIGAKIFVGGIEAVSTELGIPNIILAFLIAPVATELPEKFNSVLWYWRGKDTLALGNITGAMVFQSSIPVSIGMVFTSWVLQPINVASMLFAMAAISLIFIELRRFGSLSYKGLLLSGGFYFAYLALIVLSPSVLL